MSEDPPCTYVPALRLGKTQQVKIERREIGV
jgi:hypothetical protein